MPLSRDGAPSPPPPLWPYVLACAATALWADLGSLHVNHHSDSILFALISLYRWTPFYWELGRYGMVIPWLAGPIKDPLANLLFQGFLTTTCGLAAFFLLARQSLRNGSYPLAATLGATTFLALTGRYYRFEYLIDTSYGLGMCLALGGLILLEPRPGGPRGRGGSRRSG